MSSPGVGASTNDVTRPQIATRGTSPSAVTDQIPSVPKANANATSRRTAHGVLSCAERMSEWAWNDEEAANQAVTCEGTTRHVHAFYR
jgi:hypothetical protein